MEFVDEEKLEKSHNPCFNRIIFAILDIQIYTLMINCHNPCFNRIIFAMP